MRRSLIVALLFIAPACFAQGIETACPTGTSVLSQIQDPVTKQYRQFMCVDGTGNVSFPTTTSYGVGTYPAPLDNQSHITYDAAHRAFYVERTDGSFQAVWCIRNDQSTGGVPPTEMCISADTGGQFNFTEYSADAGAVQSLLTLNHSGQFGLCAPVGVGGSGGITNDLSGNTIIPAGSSTGTNCQAFPPSALKIAPNGTLASFLGQAPAGIGIPIIVFRGSSTLTGSFGPFTLFTTAASCVSGISNCPGVNGLYHFSWYGVVTTAAAGATLQITLSYNDGVAQTANCFAAPVAFGAINTHASCDLTIYSAVSQPIQVTFTTAGGSPSYLSVPNLQSFGS